MTIKLDLVKFLIYYAAKSLQSCSTLCDPIDGSPPGSPVPGILQASTLEWVAIAFSNYSINTLNANMTLIEPSEFEGGGEYTLID